MAYFWRCSVCRWLGTFDDDETPSCLNPEHEHDAKGYADAESDLMEGSDR